MLQCVARKSPMHSKEPYHKGDGQCDVMSHVLYDSQRIRKTPCTLYSTCGRTWCTHHIWHPMHYISYPTHYVLHPTNVASCCVCTLHNTCGRILCTQYVQHPVHYMSYPTHYIRNITHGIRNIMYTVYITPICITYWKIMYTLCMTPLRIMYGTLCIVNNTLCITFHPLHIIYGTLCTHYIWHPYALYTEHYAL